MALEQKIHVHLTNERCSYGQLISCADNLDKNNVPQMQIAVFLFFLLEYVGELRIFVLRRRKQVQLRNRQLKH